MKNSFRLEFFPFPQGVSQSSWTPCHPNLPQKDMAAKWKGPGQAEEKEAAGAQRRPCAAENSPVRGRAGGVAEGGGAQPPASLRLTSGGWKVRCPTCGALALVAVGVVDALRPVQTRGAGAVVDVDLAHRPGET